MTTPQPDDSEEAMTNQSPAEGLRQQLAAIEHERWADWQAWCHKILRENCPSPELEKVLERWDRQIATPYDKLSDSEKASDMEQVDRYWPLVTAYAATVEREAAKKQATSDLQVVFDTYSGSISPDFAFELMKERLAALQGPIQGDSNTSEEASSTQ